MKHKAGNHLKFAACCGGNRPLLSINFVIVGIFMITVQIRHPSISNSHFGKD